jgi:hypothetical protein
MCPFNPPRLSLSPQCCRLCVGLGRPVVRIRTSLQVGSSRTRCHGPWAMPAMPPGLYGLKRCLLLQPLFSWEIHVLMPPIAPRKKIYSFTLRRQEEHIPPGFQRGPVELDPNDLAARAWCDYGVSQLDGLAAGRWKRWKHHPEPRGCLIGLFITFLFVFDRFAEDMMLLSNFSHPLPGESIGDMFYLPAGSANPRTW